MKKILDCTKMRDLNLFYAIKGIFNRLDLILIIG